MTARLLITYFEIANLRCSKRDIIPASVYDLLVFVCTGTPMANLITLLSILCIFFRSVFLVRENISPDHKSVSISLKKLINVIKFLYPDSKTVC